MGSSTGDASTNSTWHPTLSPGRPRCHLHRLLKLRAIRHQRGGSDDAKLVRLDYGAVDAGSQAEVVRIDDEPPQAASLAGPRMHSMWRRKHRTRGKMLDH